MAAALLAPVMCHASPGERTALKLTFCCKADNDLYRVLSPKGEMARYDTPVQAVAAAPRGTAVALLAGGYPERTTEIAPAVFEQAAAKHLRLYVEYPSALPGMAVGQPRGTSWEREVVSSDWFGEALPKLTILAIHDCHFVPMTAPNPRIVVARVAGFDKAVYGLPKQTWPVLLEAPGGVLVATTKLSQFVTARYAPTEAWRVIWQRIVEWLCPGQAVPAIEWTPTVRPSFGKNEKLPADVEEEAFRRATTWFLRSGLLAKQSSEREIEPGVHVAPCDPGDGSNGILEGFGAHIHLDGSQDILSGKRSDCNGESAMGIAFGGVLDHDARSRKVAGNILDYWLTKTIAQRGVREDPSSPAYGLIAWGISSWALEKAYYGDDNARFLLGTMATAALLKTDRWDGAIMKCLLANLRTTGRYGFRDNRIDIENLEVNGWRHYYEGSTVSYSPHYQAYLWACYLWAYRATGYKPFLTRTETALRMTMAAYPDRWHWTNGIAQERARLILPLAWLVRLSDTKEHREWLHRVTEDLLRLQAPCGAIREELGKPGMGAYGPPRSNEAYGTNEATLLQKNGDPVSDLLYTTNFAFLGLHEAAAATGDAYYARAENKLAKFLCRIQVRSEAHPELDGGWFRAFDYARWDYWGSSADAGWGVWSIETGWTQGWITAVLGLRQMRTSLWDLTAHTHVGSHFAWDKPRFFPGGDQLKTNEIIKHLAVGKAVTLATPPDPRYPGMGKLTLTDGRRGTADCHDPAWIGLEGPDLVATIDLGRATKLRSIASGYLQDVGMGIFLPKSVEYSVSTDGKNFTPVATVANHTPETEEGPLRKDFAAEFAETTARYVRVHAKSVGVIPQWHPSKGAKAWLFADEIVVR